jgi:hypothetical protein
MNIYLLNTLIEHKETLLLSFINPQIDRDAKLTPKSIIGFVLDNEQPISENNIRINPAFLDHLHKTVLFFAQFNDGLIHLVEQQQNGFIYVKDLRSKEQDRAIDIIGSFEVQHGVLLHESYIPNPHYKPITAAGGFVLQPELEALLYNTAY